MMGITGTSEQKAIKLVVEVADVVVRGLQIKRCDPWRGQCY